MGSDIDILEDLFEERDKSLIINTQFQTDLLMINFSGSRRKRVFIQ